LFDEHLASNHAEGALAVRHRGCEVDVGRRTYVLPKNRGRTLNGVSAGFVRAFELETTAVLCQESIKVPMEKESLHPAPTRSDAQRSNMNERPISDRPIADQLAGATAGRWKLLSIGELGRADLRDRRLTTTKRVSRG